MKTTKQFLLLVFIFAVTMISCKKADSPGNPCSSPTQFATLGFINSSTISLSWTSAADQTSWEVEYGLFGFTQGDGTIVVANSNEIEIDNLDFLESYSFYVRAVCGTSDHSAWVGPVTVEANNMNQTRAFMNANIQNVQYNNMRPFGFLINQRAVFVRFYLVDNIDHKFMLIQGNNMPGQIDQNATKEVNIELREEDWVVGTHFLGTDPSDNGQDANSFMNLVFFDGTTDTTEEIGGSVTITEFNLDTRSVKGTFTYTFNRVTDSGTVNGPYNCDGDFDFSLDDPEFD